MNIIVGLLLIHHLIYDGFICVIVFGWCIVWNIQLLLC